MSNADNCVVLWASHHRGPLPCSVAVHSSLPVGFSSRVASCGSACMIDCLSPIIFFQLLINYDALYILYVNFPLKVKTIISTEEPQTGSTPVIHAAPYRLLSSHHPIAPPQSPPPAFWDSIISSPRGPHRHSQPFPSPSRMQRLPTPHSLGGRWARGGVSLHKTSHKPNSY
ncbi:hypothetical protein LIA77_09807 [Sarocladium implicatum]|nr:hypothetical protein LIA77_09807 [Sarocladium implicatum]